MKHLASDSHLAMTGSSGFLSIRLSTHEVLQWSESFDHLLSHKCKWIFSIFQGEQSLLPCPVQSAPTKWVSPQFSSIIAVSRVLNGFYFLLLPRPTQFLSPLSLSYITLIFLCCEDSVMQSLQPNKSHTYLWPSNQRPQLNLKIRDYFLFFPLFAFIF